MLRYFIYISIICLACACNSKRDLAEKTQQNDQLGVLNILDIERKPQEALVHLATKESNAEVALSKALCWSEFNNTDSTLFFIEQSKNYSYSQFDSLLFSKAEAYLIMQRESPIATIKYLKEIDLDHKQSLVRAHYFRLIAQYYMYTGDFDSALKNIIQGLLTLRRDLSLEFNVLSLDLELMRTDALINSGKVTQAIQVLNYIKGKLDIDPNLYYTVKSNILLSKIHSNMGNDEKAFEYLLPAISSAKELDDKNLLIEIYSSIASVFAREKNNDKTLEYLTYALNILQNNEVNHIGGELFLSLGHAYYLKDNQFKALIYFKKGLEFFQKQNNTLKKAWCYYSLGKVYLAQGANLDAKKYFKLAEELRSKNHFTESFSTIDLRINLLFYNAKIAVLEGNSNVGFTLLKEAYQMALSENCDRLQVMVLEELLVVSEKVGDLRSALNYYKSLELVKHQIEVKKKSYMISAAELEFRSLENRQKIQMQEVALEVQKKEITKITSLSIFLGVISLTCILLLIVVNRLRRKRIVNLNKLAAQNSELQKINAFKDQLISVIGHDLRSPIGMLESSLDFFTESADELPKEDILKFIKAFKPGVSQTYSMLNNLLAWAQSQQGRLHLNRKATNLGSLMSNEIEILKQQAEGKQISLNVMWDKNIELYCDKPTMSTALRNIISNALKFTPTGGEVKLTSTQDANTTRLIIADTGVGMDDKLIGKILNGEKITSAKGTNNERGTGLGLFICKDYITKNGGEMLIKSKKGEGTIITVAVPSGHIIDSSAES